MNAEAHSWGRRASVLGAGAWGTALAVHLSRCNFEVVLWARSEERVRELVEVPLSPQIRATADLGEAALNDLVLVVVPSHAFREVLGLFLDQRQERRRANREEVGPVTVVSGAKGIEVETLARMSAVSFEEAAKRDQDLRFAVLSGPSFAEELIQGAPTACVIAGESVVLARALQRDLSVANLRLYASADVAGVEIGGAAKNVIAIAAGAVAGLGLGHNTLAALITRGLHEISRLGRACKGQSRTLAGLAGLGDLVLTCTGGASRNRRTGSLLAQGLSLQQAAEELHGVAEGVKNSLAIQRLAARLGVEMPITEQMVEVLYRGKPVDQAIGDLMSRHLKVESE